VIHVPPPVAHDWSVHAHRRPRLTQIPVVSYQARDEIVLQTIRISKRMAAYRPLNNSPSPPLTPQSDRSPNLSLRALELSESYPDDARPRTGRSNTVTSFAGAGFEFEHSLLPLTLSGENENEATGDDERHVGLWHAIGLVVGMQVGSGIFSSPGVIVASVGSVGASLMVWVVSGLLAWTGARCVSN
jgi:hypothetical protein